MFNRNYARNILKKILLKYIDDIPLSLNVKRNWLRALHYVLPFMLIFFVTLGNKFHFYLGIAISVVIIVLFKLLNGCVISSLENKLFRDNSNITDVVLELLILKKTRHNQIRITQYIFALWITYVIFIYNYRFT